MANVENWCLYKRLAVLSTAIWDNVRGKSATLAAILYGVRLQVETTGHTVNKVINRIIQWAGPLKTPQLADNHANYPVLALSKKLSINSYKVKYKTCKVYISPLNFFYYARRQQRLQNFV